VGLHRPTGEADAPLHPSHSIAQNSMFSPFDRSVATIIVIIVSWVTILNTFAIFSLYPPSTPE
jgi:hypothetical protein